MSGPAPLRQAFVARLFLTDAALVEGTPAAALLRRWWEAARALGMVHTVAGRPDRLPAAPTGRTGRVEPRPRVLAAVQHSGGGAFEMLVVTAVHDMVVVAVLLAPNDDRSDWAGLAARWWGTVGRPGPAAGLLGSAEQLFGELPPPVATLAPDALAEWLAPSVPDPGPQGPPAAVGALHAWELSAGPGWWAGHQRLLTVSAEADAAELSRWSWQGVRAGAPPATVHLLVAARIRHQCGALREEVPALWELADRVGQACQAVGAAGDSGAAATTGERLLLLESALGALEPVRQEAAAGVQRLRRRESDLAGAEETLHLLDGEGAALAAPELRLIRWARAQIRTLVDALALADERAGAAADRASAAADRLAQARRDRLTLSQTSVLGSLLLALAAIQSLGYRVPLPNPVQPGLIAFLASLALVLPWLAQPRQEALLLRSFGRGFDLLLFAVSGACAGWLVGSSAAWWAGSPLPPPLVAAVGAAVAAVVRARAFRRRR
ncbi:MULTISPECIES: CATRA conflict system CASPASE/TPR repeat-associated protein [unclassified Streptomyces]|uniref:CATRA conflict system CASPASE/TPR repeat-associated protein n=1 Tax=unclassified Streptomyces TaxID=2593676 RepID=UPI0004BD90CC|nr:MULTISPECIES: CATRA conflict system CASPASE/TPR repeat-associated protein [unclassified Streptomyces]